MPPKPKFAREDIVAAAVEIVRRAGESALTAREVGRRLGTSSSPIFTVFGDMEELRRAVWDEAKERFDEYMAVAEKYSPAYKKRGMQWVRFAQEEPWLFRMLFMRQNGGEDFDNMMRSSPFGKANDMAIIARDYHATPERSEELFRQMWIYTYGLCVLCATGACSFSEEEIALRLGEMFTGAVMALRSGGLNDARIVPVERDSAEGEDIRRRHPDLSGETGLK